MLTVDQAGLSVEKAGLQSPDEFYVGAAEEEKVEVEAAWIWSSVAASRAASQVLAGSVHQGPSRGRNLKRREAWWSTSQAHNCESAWPATHPQTQIDRQPGTPGHGQSVGESFFHHLWPSGSVWGP
jgi:hypothetical protein